MDNALFDTDSSQIDSNSFSQKFVLGDALNELESRKNLDGLVGIPSGFIALDRLLSGWQKSELIILASRPGMGKSSLLLSFLRNAAVDFGQPVGLFSLETVKVKIANRLFATEAEVSLEKIQKGTLAPHEWTKISLSASRLTEAPLFIDDTYDLKFEDLRAKSLQMIKRHGVKIIAVDNIHLMLSTNAEEAVSEYEEMSKLIRNLKKLSVELDIPIIALSQLNRTVETRGGDKKPQIHDLRGSGAIEEHSDVVMLLYRPEYYNIIQDEEGNSTAGIGEIFIAKNRHGSRDTIRLRFVGKYTKFCDLDTNFGTVFTQGFSAEMDPQPSAGSVFNSKANNLSNFGNADPSQETPF